MKRIINLFVVTLLLSFSFIVQSEAKAESSTESEVGITFEGEEYEPPIFPLPNDDSDISIPLLDPPIQGQLPQTSESVNRGSLLVGLFLVLTAYYLTITKRDVNESKSSI
ncbi:MULTISPECIES: LPXTG cell wall anchor domain-containing protein [Carnobacterium]|uniref:Gram-positive cocci surface proteins LPxTG domain-containing protein n=1 Tax=Carnobacterium divergens TaxID=2748 RepID=A0A2R8A4N8_CARDV|nr:MULTISPECIES: LPXTG cell wall anchor domain-containing protein [Carnobacterium]MCO6019033.1 LPXTG cell wall anchor domain-containing protein [Carnobacterium divergens]MDT1940706.1 LPXTG cell wall anchor domain-containing protein [Carnobacterium divergens]MDT1943144.1 LPXTG cell wall anchor domain-containing protein [Carnobacterium divergens]MDT1948951.1 LPXTG cell wall anchor domain-containing protein [Carnobacterium divergens]MDT1951432.1 LPXTG cell wall anchor domain-containing protein [C